MMTVKTKNRMIAYSGIIGIDRLPDDQVDTWIRLNGDPRWKGDHEPRVWKRKGTKRQRLVWKHEELREDQTSGMEQAKAMLARFGILASH